MKYIHVYALCLMPVFITSCGQSQINAANDKIKAETKDPVTSQVPNSMVRHVRQASNGDILVASFQGVFRYDGKSFTNITSTISSPSFWDVLEDRKGNLWFATRDSGVYHYNGKSFQHFTTKDGLASNMALHIYEDRAGNIWFGASRYDGKSFRNFTTKDGFPSNDMRLILEDKTGKFWFGTRDNIFVYDGKTFTVLKNKDGKAFKNVWAIIEDKKGNIWLGDCGYDLSCYGLWRYDGRTFTKVSQRGAYAIIEDKKGNIWTTGAVNPNGNVWALTRYDQKSLYDKEPTVTEIMSKQTGFFCGILEANDGSIWFGSAGPGGVYRYDGVTITDFTSKNFTIDTKESVVSWKGSMVIGTNSQTGYVYLSRGELMMENDQLMGGTVEVDMNTIAEKTHGSDNELVRHLKSPDFFDVKRFPNSTIAIARVDSINVEERKITGSLTIKGITHPVTFPAKIEVKDSIFEANGKLVIDRTLWDVRYKSRKFYNILADQAMSDSIEFHIKIVAKKKHL